MIRLVAKRWLKEGVLEDYLALARQLAEQTRQEAGCVDYALCSGGDGLVAFLETWADQESLNAHAARLQAENWGQRLNAFADPARPPLIEKYFEL